jgi:RimJ/RimL family protein N-acetyltransferase
MGDFLRERSISTRAVIRVEPANQASVRVAEKSGFVPVRDFDSYTDHEPDGSPATLRLFDREL